MLRVNPERFPGRIDAAGAKRFAEFLLAKETQHRIALFGVDRYGRPLFRHQLGD